MSDIATAALVQTAGGKVEGLKRPGHLAFYGIPYAAAPTGERRFRPPAPAPSWTGVRQATQIGFAAPQTPHFVIGFAASGPQDEDCLNLNVFTPAADGAKRPVMVWIHGGGFTHGAGYEALYDGGRLATRGEVVVVSLNYRLGALGFLSIPEARIGANQGLLDQVAALRWVKDNIAAFGGDPDEVTIFGESAGSASVGCLVAMPAARGLFKRAIYQSGAGRPMGPEAAAKVADTLLHRLGLDRSRASELFQLPTDAILEAQAKSGLLPGQGFAPVRDPETLPENPLEVAARGEASGVAVLIGSNRDEMKLFNAAMPREPLDDAGLGAAVARMLPKASADHVASLIETYRASRSAKGLPTEGLDLLDAIQSDLTFTTPSMRLAAAQSAHQPKTFMYLFTHASPARRGKLGASHALEMPFVFGTLDLPTQRKFAGEGPEVERLSAEMMDAWIAFARTGDPNHPGLPAWPPYDGERRATMIFDSAASRVENDPFGEERAALLALTA